jgi:hypothetical protein
MCKNCNNTRPNWKYPEDYKPIDYTWQPPEPTYCVKCGHKLEWDWEYCPNCGTPKNARPPVIKFPPFTL